MATYKMISTGGGQYRMPSSSEQRDQIRGYSGGREGAIRTAATTDRPTPNTGSDRYTGADAKAKQQEIARRQAQQNARDSSTSARAARAEAERNAAAQRSQQEQLIRRQQEIARAAEQVRAQEEERRAKVEAARLARLEQERQQELERQRELARQQELNRQRELARQQELNRQRILAQQNQRSSGYTSFGDIFDGGGPGRSGARFSVGDTSALDLNGDGYISEAEYAQAEQDNPDLFSDSQSGIASLSNAMGFRPYGSYDQERGLGAEGTNIGTSGFADFLAGQGMIGDFIRGGVPSSLQQVNPNMPIGARLDPQAVSLYEEKAPEVPSFFERLTGMGGTTTSTPQTMPVFPEDNDSSPSVTQEPVSEAPITDPADVYKAIHIAPLRQLAYGGIVSLGRR